MVIAFLKRAIAQLADAEPGAAVHFHCLTTNAVTIENQIRFLGRCHAWRCVE
jgi:hypothetical protein